MRRLFAAGCWLFVAGTSFAAAVLPLAGEGWRKVDVTLEARSTAADATFAADPELEILHGSRRLPCFVLQVRDADGRRATDAGTFRNVVWSGDWRRYVRRIWVPPTAKDIRVSAPRGCEVREAKAGLSEEPGLAVNGDFALGPYNYSGWRRCDRHVLVGCGTGGKGLLNTCPDGCVSSEPMPVRPGLPLRLDLTWANPSRKRLRVAVTFGDAKGKRCGGFVWNAPKPSGTYDFNAPEGAETVTLAIYEGRVESWAITERKEK